MEAPRLSGGFGLRLGLRVSWQCSSRCTALCVFFKKNSGIDCSCFQECLVSEDSGGVTESAELQQLRDQIWQLHEDLGRVKIDVAAINTWRENEIGKHASFPTWLFGILSTLISVASVLISLYMAGVWQ